MENKVKNLFFLHRIAPVLNNEKGFQTTLTRARFQALYVKNLRWGSTMGRMEDEEISVL